MATVPLIHSFVWMLLFFFTFLLICLLQPSTDLVSLLTWPFRTFHGLMMMTMMLLLLPSTLSHWCFAYTFLHRQKYAKWKWKIVEKMDRKKWRMGKSAYVRASVCVRWWELSSKICPAMIKPFSYIRRAVTCGLNWVSSYKHVCTHKSVSLFAILQHGKLLLLLLFLSSTSSFWKMKMQNKPQNLWRKWLARSHENCACTFICICTYLWGDWT